MEKCERHIQEYITKEDAKKDTANALKANSEYYQAQIKEINDKHHAEKRSLTAQFWRTDKFFMLVCEQVRKKSSVDLVFADWTKAGTWGMLNDDLESTRLVKEEINNLLQMGFDFQVLLHTMKNDEVLERQWYRIVMSLRLLGYDSFDSVKDI